MGQGCLLPAGSQAGASPDTLGHNAEPCCHQLAPLCLSFPFPGQVSNTWHAGKAQHTVNALPGRHAVGLWGEVLLHSALTGLQPEMPSNWADRQSGFQRSATG